MKTKLALGAVSALGLITSVYAADPVQLALHDCNKHQPCTVSQNRTSAKDETHRQMGTDKKQEMTQEHRANGKVITIHSYSAPVGSKAFQQITKITGITLDHEPIPALNWPAMTMEFGVASSNIGRGIKPGDTVSFRFVQRGNKYIVTHLERTGS